MLSLLYIPVIFHENSGLFKIEALCVDCPYDSIGLLPEPDPGDQ